MSIYYREKKIISRGHLFRINVKLFGKDNKEQMIKRKNNRNLLRLRFIE